MAFINRFDLLAILEKKLEARRLREIKQSILDHARADPSLRCTLNARVLNHGVPSNITLGSHLVLDGTLECYEHGRMEIGAYTYIGQSRLFCASRLTVGKGVMVSDNVIIMDSDLHPISGQSRSQSMQEWAQGKFPNVYTNVSSGPVSVGDMAWIGANSVILKNVSVGEGAIIGAGSVVTLDVAPWTVVAGNPARVLRELALHER